MRMPCEPHARAREGMRMRSCATAPYHAATARQLLSRLVLRKDEAHAAACRRRSRLSRSAVAAARPSTSRKQHTREPWRSISDRPHSAPAARRDAHDASAFATAIMPTLPPSSGIAPSDIRLRIHLHVDGVSEGLQEVPR